MFLREPPDPTSVFQATCGIHVARPQVCRVFPLGRWFRAETTDSHVFTLTDQRVLVQTQVCPPPAFTQGHSQTATQFLQDQRAEEYEYAIVSLVGDFFQEHSEDLSSLAPETSHQLYQALITRLYYTQDYTPDIEVFYQQLFALLHEFFQGFHELYQQEND